KRFSHHWRPRERYPLPEAFLPHLLSAPKARTNKHVVGPAKVGEIGDRSRKCVAHPDNRTPVPDCCVVRSREKAAGSHRRPRSNRRQTPRTAPSRHPHGSAAE